MPSLIGLGIATMATVGGVYTLYRTSSGRAKPDENPIKSFGAGDPIFLGETFYSGYIHVGKTLGQMFYWYAPARHNPDTAPFLVWLTGGPGCSSELAILTENGPWWVQPDATLKINKQSWTEVANVIWVDQPLGTGFSDANDPRNYVLDENKIAAHFHEFLTKFVEKFPKLKNRDFHLTGESYAGHYIPAIGHHLLQNPIEGVNFMGVAIGNGWVDPYTQYPAYSKFAYENNMISKTTFELANTGYAACDKLIDQGYWPLAMVQCQAVTAGILGKKNPYDIRLDCEVPPLCYNQTYLDTFLNREDVQSALGVHKQWESCDNVVHVLLIGDWVTDMKSKVSALINAGKKVLVYSGDKDFICNWVGGLAWLEAVEWKGQKEFKSKPLADWKVGSTPAGQMKKLNNLTFLRMYDAGHMVPMDQPEAALEMLKEYLTPNSVLLEPQPPVASALTPQSGKAAEGFLLKETLTIY